MTDATTTGAPAAPTVSDLDASSGSWGTSTFALRHPFQWKGVTYAEVDMRVPTGHDMAQYYGNARRNSVDFMVGLSQLPAGVFDVMNAEDWTVIFAWAMSFFPAAQ